MLVDLIQVIMPVKKNSWAEMLEDAVADMHRDQLYKNWSSRKTDSQYKKTSSGISILLKILSKNQFLGKTYFIQLHHRTDNKSISSFVFRNVFFLDDMLPAEEAAEGYFKDIPRYHHMLQHVYRLVQEQVVIVLNT